MQLSSPQCQAPDLLSTAAARLKAEQQRFQEGAGDTGKPDEEESINDSFWDDSAEPVNCGDARANNSNIAGSNKGEALHSWTAQDPRPAPASDPKLACYAELPTPAELAASVASLFTQCDQAPSAGQLSVVSVEQLLQAAGADGLDLASDEATAYLQQVLSTLYDQQGPSAPASTSRGTPSAASAKAGTQAASASVATGGTAGPAKTGATACRAGGPTTVQTFPVLARQSLLEERFRQRVGIAATAETQQADSGRQPAAGQQPDHGRAGTPVSPAATHQQAHARGIDLGAAEQAQQAQHGQQSSAPDGVHGSHAPSLEHSLDHAQEHCTDADTQPHVRAASRNSQQQPFSPWPGSAAFDAQQLAAIASAAAAAATAAMADHSRRLSADSGRGVATAQHSRTLNANDANACHGGARAQRTDVSGQAVAVAHHSRLASDGSPAAPTPVAGTADNKATSPSLVRRADAPGRGATAADGQSLACSKAARAASAELAPPLAAGDDITAATNRPSENAAQDPQQAPAQAATASAVTPDQETGRDGLVGLGASANTPAPAEAADMHADALAPQSQPATASNARNLMDQRAAQRVNNIPHAASHPATGPQPGPAPAAASQPPHGSLTSDPHSPAAYGLAPPGWRFPAPAGPPMAIGPPAWGWPYHFPGPAPLPTVPPSGPWAASAAAAGQGVASAACAPDIAHAGNEPAAWMPSQQTDVTTLPTVSTAAAHYSLPTRPMTPQPLIAAEAAHAAAPPSRDASSGAGAVGSAAQVSPSLATKASQGPQATTATTAVAPKPCLSASLQQSVANALDALDPVKVAERAVKAAATASAAAVQLPAPTDATHEEARRATVHALGGAFEYSSSRHALEELSSVANRLAASRAQQPALKASRMAKGRFMARSPETASKGSPAAYLSDYMATDAAWDSPEAFQEALRRDVDQRIATVHLRPPPAVPVRTAAASRASRVAKSCSPEDRSARKRDRTISPTARAPQHASSQHAQHSGQHAQDHGRQGHPHSSAIATAAPLTTVSSPPAAKRQRPLVAFGSRVDIQRQQPNQQPQARGISRPAHPQATQHAHHAQQPLGHASPVQAQHVEAQQAQQQGQRHPRGAPAPAGRSTSAAAKAGQTSYQGDMLRALTATVMLSPAPAASAANAAVAGGGFPELTAGAEASAVHQASEAQPAPAVPRQTAATQTADAAAHQAASPDSAAAWGSAGACLSGQAGAQPLQAAWPDVGSFTATVAVCQPEAEPSKARDGHTAMTFHAAIPSGGPSRGPSQRDGAAGGCQSIPDPATAAAHAVLDRELRPEPAGSADDGTGASAAGTGVADGELDAARPGRSDEHDHSLDESVSDWLAEAVAARLIVDSQQYHYHTHPASVQPNHAEVPRPSSHAVDEHSTARLAGSAATGHPVSTAAVAHAQQPLGQQAEHAQRAAAALAAELHQLLLSTPAGDQAWAATAPRSDQISRCPSAPATAHHSRPDDHPISEHSGQIRHAEPQPLGTTHAHPGGADQCHVQLQDLDQKVDAAVDQALMQLLLQTLAETSLGQLQQQKHAAHDAECQVSVEATHSMLSTPAAPGSAVQQAVPVGQPGSSHLTDDGSQPVDAAGMVTKKTAATGKAGSVTPQPSARPDQAMLLPTVLPNQAATASASAVAPPQAYYLIPAGQYSPGLAYGMPQLAAAAPASSQLHAPQQLALRPIPGMDKLVDSSDFDTSVDLPGSLGQVMHAPPSPTTPGSSADPLPHLLPRSILTVRPHTPSDPGLDAVLPAGGSAAEQLAAPAAAQHGAAQHDSVESSPLHAFPAEHEPSATETPAVAQSVPNAAADHHAQVVPASFGEVSRPAAPEEHHATQHDAAGKTQDASIQDIADHSSRTVNDSAGSSDRASAEKASMGEEAGGCHSQGGSERAGHAEAAGDKDAVQEQPAGEPVQPAAVGAKQGAAPPLASKLPPRRLWREQPHMAERWWAACDSRLTSYNASSAGYASSEPSSNAVDVSAEPSASALPKAPRRAGISRAGRYAVRRRQVMRQAGIVDPLLNSTTRDSSDSGSDAAATSGSTSGSESGSGSPSQSDATSSFVAGRISLDQASGGGSEFRIPAVGGMADRVGVKGRMGVNPASVQALQLRLAALQR